MRTKSEPDDFRVEEVLRTGLRNRGSHVVYRIEKLGLTTQEARDRLGAALGLPPGGIQLPAQKDKSARSIQHFSVAAGPGPRPREFNGPGVRARQIGFLDRHLDPRDLAGNRFLITVRDLSGEEAAEFPARLDSLAASGLPNYFDSQRFGSYAPGLGFPGRLLLDRRWEDALRAFLSEAQVGDDSGAAAEKAAIRLHWGDFQAAFAAAPRSHRRSILAYLKDHPASFRQAVDRVRSDLVSLWLSAYQSHLWNRIAGRLVGEESRRLGIRTREFQLPGPASLPQPLSGADALGESFRALSVPLPHHRLKSLPPPLEAAFAEVLAEERLDLKNLKARGVERAWLAKGLRRLWLWPLAAKVVSSAADARYPGRFQAVVAFDLPPGSYATLVLRMLETE